MAVSLLVATHQGSLPVAYRLYLPKDWANDPVRRGIAGVPDDVRFQTMPEIALQQLCQALADSPILFHFDVQSRSAALSCGRPRRLPFARARSRPAFVRWLIFSRSSFASEARVASRMSRTSSLSVERCSSV